MKTLAEFRSNYLWACNEDTYISRLADGLRLGVANLHCSSYNTLRAGKHFTVIQTNHCHLNHQLGEKNKIQHAHLLYLFCSCSPGRAVNRDLEFLFSRVSGVSPGPNFIELLSPNICLACNFFLDKNRFTYETSI